MDHTEGTSEQGGCRLKVILSSLPVLFLSCWFLTREEKKRVLFIELLNSNNCGHLKTSFQGILITETLWKDQYFLKLGRLTLPALNSGLCLL